MKLGFVYNVLPVFIFERKSFNNNWQDGKTICNTIQLVSKIYNATDINSLALIEHEKVHVKQFYRSIGLNSLLILIPYFKARLEAEAYVVQINYLINHNCQETIVDLINNFSQILATDYDLPYSQEYCKTLIHKYLNI